MRNNLRQLLQERNMSQKDLSVITGIPEYAISRYVNSNVLGEKYLLLLAIADALHVTPDDIISKEN